VAAKRLIVTGLDGLSLELAVRLAGQGVMPNLAGLLEKGRAWEVTSPLPEVSPVCWTSLFSGQEPGVHGIFGFGLPEPGSYEVRPAHGNMVRCPRLWDRVSQAGRAAAVLNVPLTYPARPLKGVMVSGFVTPDLERGVYPSSFRHHLEEMGYRPEADLDLGQTQPQALIQDLMQVLDARIDLFTRMLSQPWDLYVAVITETDRVNHFFWPVLNQPDPSLSELVLAVYRRIDEYLGVVEQMVAPQIKSGDLAWLLVADHGFGPIKSEVYLNPWLQSRGYLHVQGEPGQERILPQTQALALDPGRIYLHWAGRFPGGRLRPGSEAEKTLEGIRAELSALDLNGEGLVAKVHRGRDLYSGPQAALAPDLVVEASWGFSMRAGLGKSGIWGKSHLTGTHRPQGAMASWLGGGLTQDAPEHLTGLYSLMADWLGVDRV
jgi:predicted AlkP superfamily phosphohydrolase/phosphomutase